MSRADPVAPYPDPSPAPETEPARDCPLCLRLVAFREAWREREPSWHNAPVPTWGDPTPQLLVVGLAPGLRGANASGRPFTGDFAGRILYAALACHGFAVGTFQARPDDGFTLAGAAVTNAVRCAPPENKPTAAEINMCRGFLAATVQALPSVRAILALGRIAHDSTVRALGEPAARRPFAHGSEHAIGDITLFGTYHTSRYNLNTGVLTEEMFDAVVARVAAFLRR